MATNSDATGRSLATYGIVVVAAVLIGTALAPQVWGVVADDGESDAVAVVEVSGSITGDSVDSLRETLRNVRANESIKAVVLEVDSPGGSAAASESLYLAVNETASEMPVVASVQSTAASGAYYGMAPSEKIYALPSSTIGSIGVYATKPSTVPDQYVRSGPDKGTRGTTEDVRETVEQLQRAFLETVMVHREAQLDLTRGQIAHGNVYTGAESVSNGLADEIGTLDSAIGAAAQRADLDTYDIVHRELDQRQIVLFSQANETTAVSVSDDQFGYEGVDTTQYLMLWGHLENVEGVSADE
ncbi:S49 family peptidase [Halorhabdus sp. CUG00001]|uniref:S49 family peptidase n=1 Tax=Halorhabdus sp. CUG00001 TaxID=2600297 RepID=UPI00131CC2EC|nr:S49 family peptidase [Halorhabdus sp. CUG00001]